MSSSIQCNLRALERRVSELEKSDKRISRRKRIIESSDPSDQTSDISYKNYTLSTPYQSEPKLSNNYVCLLVGATVALYCTAVTYLVQKGFYF